MMKNKNFIFNAGYCDHHKKNYIPWHRKHRTSNGKCKLYPIRIFGTFLNRMVTVRCITSLCTSVRTKQACKKWDGLLEISYFGFSKKKLLTITCVIWFSLQLLPEAFLILRRTERGTIKNVYWHSCKVSYYSCQIWIKLQFFRLISEKNQILNLSKIHTVGAELFHADRQTDTHDEAISRFSQYCESAGRNQ
jgi:hypothetical protein